MLCCHQPSEGAMRVLAVPEQYGELIDTWASHKLVDSFSESTSLQVDNITPAATQNLRILVSATCRS